MPSSLDLPVSLQGLLVRLHLPLAAERPSAAPRINSRPLSKSCDELAAAFWRWTQSRVYFDLG